MNSHVVKVHHASSWGTDSELGLRLGNRKSGGITLHDEAGDAFVALQLLGCFNDGDLQIIIGAILADLEVIGVCFTYVQLSIKFKTRKKHINILIFGFEVDHNC